MATDDRAPRLGRPDRPTAWYRRRGVLWGAGIAVFVGAAVLSDLPQRTSRSGQIASAVTLVKQINSDVSPCAYAVQEAVSIEAQLTGGTLSSANRAQVPALLNDDQNACAFTNSSINDLANLQPPGIAGGKYLGDAVSSATLWTSSDALGAVEAIQKLVSSPTDAASRARLLRFESLMATDRTAVMTAVSSATRVLGASLPTVSLPVLPPNG
ncbi:MAG: hypothetical protein KGQ66_09120 [Acidobacteriota bacterium]|nr:hypothetical protein [Acidobacteriota bacterium]